MPRETGIPHGKTHAEDIAGRLSQNDADLVRLCLLPGLYHPFVINTVHRPASPRRHERILKKNLN